MRMLVVDDDPLVREVLVMLLSLSGHMAREASAGTEALTRLHTEQFDAILLDYSMPEMTGVTVLEKLRGMGIDIPVGFITGSRDHPDIEKLLSDAIPILFKPFAPAEFKAFVDRLEGLHVSMSSQ